MAYLNIGGTNIHYELWGSGQPLLLLHGNGEDSTYFAGQIKEFSKRYMVIAVDSRAHGLSQGGQQKLSLKQMAEDVLCIMEALSLQKAHILGFSDGGNIALYFALKYPDKVSSLILDGANLFPCGLKLSANIAICSSYIWQVVFGIFSKKSRKKKNITALMIGSPDIKPEQLKGITVPTLLIAGENDMVKHSHTQLIQDSLVASKLVIIPGADHFAAQKKPHEFNKAVQNFLSSL